MKPSICVGCPWYSTGLGYVPPSPAGKRDVVIVSDYPEVGETEPFTVGRAADMFNRTLRRLQRRKDSYGITYLSHCTPRFTGKPQKRFDITDADGWFEATQHCIRVHNLNEQYHPRVIVPLGSAALEQHAGILANDLCRGYVYESPRYSGVRVLGTYHPAMVGAGNTGLLFTLRYDLANVLHKCSDDFGHNPKNFIIDPHAGYFSELIDTIIKHSEWCVVDIETPYMASQDESAYSKLKPSFDIIRLSLCASCDPTTSITISFMPEYFDAFYKLMGSGLDIVYWNGDYDDPRLAYNGMPRKGKFVDAMWLWHFLQPDLPKALGHVSTYFTDLPEWKSKSEADPAYYSACDAYAEAQCYLRIVKSLKDKGMYEVADRHVTKLLGVLKKVSAKGILVDMGKLQKVKDGLEKKLEVWDNKIKEMHPDEAKEIRWYKKPPPGYKKGIVKVGTRKAIGGRPGCYICTGDKWGFRFDFNPNSGDQLKAYLRWRGISIPRKHKTRKETTDNKALNRILAQTGDPIVKEILDRAKTAKVFSTYTSWPIDKDNRVHPQFQLTPATGRLSCERPNFQNIPKEGELADMIRECLIASEGCVFIAADYVGMESYLTGYFAADPTYIELSKLNIYTYIVAKYMGWPLNEDSKEWPSQLAVYKKRAKATVEKGETKTLYDKFKTIVLAIGYGAGRDTLFYQNPGLFKDLGEAGRLRKFVLDTFPKVRDWQQAIVRLASKGYLINPFKYIRYFLDCPGSDSSTAMAQLPQSTGAAIVKECILQFEETFLGEMMVLQVHDEIVWEVPFEMQEKAVKIIRRIMEQKWPQLNGHSIAVSVKVGLNLKDMKEVK